MESFRNHYFYIAQKRFGGKVGFAVILLFCALCLPSTVLAATLQATEQGVRVDAGSMGTFVLSYPALMDGGGKEVHKLIQKQAAANAAQLRYEGGGEATVTLNGGEIVFTFAHLPADVKKYRIETLIDFSYADGGKWKIGENAQIAFPQQKPAKPFLFQGSAPTFQLVNLEGKRLTFTMDSCYQQLQDNREWDWKTFDWFCLADYSPERPRYTLTVVAADAAAGAARSFVVDSFGQDARLDFPDKVKTEAQLKADVAAEKAYYAGLHPPQRDLYGGLPGSREKYGLTRSGYFHVEQKGGRWILTDPDGNAFFHLGICAFSPGDDYTWVQGRQSLYEWLPPYEGAFHTAYHPESYWSRDTLSFYLVNVIRKYGKPYDREEWLSRIIPRVRQLGFNSGGAFSAPSAAHKALHFPYVLHLPEGTDRQAPGLGGLFDPFDPLTPSQLEASYAKAVAPVADEPLIIGYYLGNEQPFEDIPRRIPQLDGKSAAKRRLVTLLQETYKTIGAFNAAWAMHADSFEALNDIGLPVTTALASADMARYTELFLDGYYGLIARTFHKYDRHHLLLGSRWQPGTANSEPLVRIAGKYMDIVSVNYYTNGLDKDFLKRLYGWSGRKPFFLSEWHYCSPSDSGLPGGREVHSQKERGLAYRNYLEQGASLGFVVGSEWFTLIDQARTGRFFEKYNGENANTGLFSVTDRPWKPFVEACAQTNDAIYRVEFGERPPFAWDDPRFTLTGVGSNTVHVPRSVGKIVPW